jgi:hypothetical protein
MFLSISNSLNGLSSPRVTYLMPRVTYLMPRVTCLMPRVTCLMPRVRVKTATFWSRFYDLS